MLLGEMLKRNLMRQVKNAYFLFSEIYKKNENLDYRLEKNIFTLKYCKIDELDQFFCFLSASYIQFKTKLLS